MWTRKYWSDAAERWVASVSLAIVSSGLALDFGSEDFWQVVGGIAGLTALKVLAASQFGANNTAAMLPESVDTERG